MSKNVVEIEVAGGRNDNLYFQPLGRSIRGEFDASKVRDKERGELMQAWPQPIPGQRLGLDVETGEAYVSDPLHEDRYEPLRTKIRKHSFAIPPERVAYPKVHVPTILYWLKRAVDSGLAKVVRGTLPETIEGKPRTDFLVNEQETKEEMLANAINRQTEAIEKQSELMTKLIAAIATKK